MLIPKEPVINRLPNLLRNVSFLLNFAQPLQRIRYIRRVAIIKRIRISKNLMKLFNNLSLKSLLVFNVPLLRRPSSHGRRLLRRSLQNIPRRLSRVLYHTPCTFERPQCFGKSCILFDVEESTSCFLIRRDALVFRAEWKVEVGIVGAEREENNGLDFVDFVVTVNFPDGDAFFDNDKARFKN